MTKEKTIRRIHNQRGYVVVWQGNSHPRFTCGQIIDSVGEGLRWGKPFKVLRRTSQRDFLAQQWRSRRISPELWKHTSVASHFRKMRKEYKDIIYWRVKVVRG